MCVLNLKYHFTQLNKEIIEQMRSKNYNNVLSLISYHISLEKETNQLNKEIKYHIYFLYKCVKPAFNIFVCLLFMKDTIFVMRVVVTIALIYCIRSVRNLLSVFFSEQRSPSIAAGLLFPTSVTK